MSDEPKKPSKAPKPITPVTGGSGSKGAWSRSAKGPDWKFWLSMPKVRLWQGAFLSCGIEPDDFSLSKILERGIDNEKAAKRLRLLLGNLNLGITSEIPLLRLSAFGISEGWDMPPELAAVAQKPDREPDAPATANAGEQPGENDTLAELFDPVTVEVLEKMFPSNNKWKQWAEKAKSNELISARVSRGKFNPYLAAQWFLNRGIPGWDWARCMRTLGKNLPPRSVDSKGLFGEID